MTRNESETRCSRIGRGTKAVAVAMLFVFVVSAAFAVRSVSADKTNDLVFPIYNPNPKDLPPIPIPADNPQTPSKVRLGERLYFDPMLSKDGTISCASCHDPAFGFSDGQMVSDGVGGSTGGRNSPTVYNAVFYTEQFWDGRAMTLEDQARGPVENPIEMANDWDNVVAYLKSDATYRRMFRQVFGGEVSEDTAVKAIASYERTIVTWNSPYDKYVNGDMNAMTADQIAGMDLFFGKASCGGCHAPPLFLEEAYGNIGVPEPEEFNESLFVNEGMPPELMYHDLGRYYVTGLDEDLGRFKTPGLRNIELTAPYMHNGVFETLEEVIDHYNMVADPIVGTLEEDLVTDLGLTDMEKSQLVEFLKALTGVTYSYVPEDVGEMMVSMVSTLAIRPLE